MIQFYVKYFVIAGFLFSFSKPNAQVLTFDHGKVEFYTATAITDIEAITEKADVKLDIATGNVEVKINIKSFEFEYDLMQEHFNEKYMESDKFPQAAFKGKILQDISELGDDREVDVSGELTIHGITKDITLKAKLSKQGDFILVKSKIPVVFKDYNVDDPSILTKSVAKDVEIKSTLYLKQQ